MSDIRDRLETVTELPELLGVACKAFEAMLEVIRRNDDPGSEYFLPMVAAGAAAASGRDFVFGAPALPLWQSAGSLEIVPESAGGGHAAVIWLRAVSEVLAGKLLASGTAAAGVADRQACWHAARCAREIHAVMRGGSR